jgi:hypothetical protein
MGALQFTPEHCRQIWEEQKWQTRRVIKEGEVAVYSSQDERQITKVMAGMHLLPRYHRVLCAVGFTETGVPGRGKPSWHRDGEFISPEEYRMICEMNGHKRRYVEETLRGHGYQPFRIMITGIRREHLWDISEKDAIAEGYGYGYCPTTGDPAFPTYMFMLGWEEIHKQKNRRWARNPEVWVREFKRANA